MIVRNETAVLERLFKSVVPYIDYYVIVDTGSTDGTQAFIREWMSDAGIEGEVHEREWVNFGHNRQEALELAVEADRCDWLLFIDADEELVVEDPEFFTGLEPGVNYYIEKRHGGSVYAIPQLIDVRHSKWEWRFPVHNALVPLSEDNKREKLPTIWIRYHRGQGAKSHGVTVEQKYLRDAAILEKYLEENPGCTRSQFYLGQSYRDAGKWQKAYRAYRKRAAMEGWAEEKFIAYFEMGRAASQLKMPEHEIVSAYLAAYEFRPQRAESLHMLARYYRENHKFNLAYLFAEKGVQIPVPDDSLYLTRAVYDWMLLDELSVAAANTHRYAESRDACSEILRRASSGVDVPVNHLERVRKNLRYAESNL